MRNGLHDAVPGYSSFNFGLMLTRLLALILLISHINFSMFIAQVDEVDTYDKQGREQEDINSLYQYVALICHIHHRPLPDSDDDNARYTLTVSMPLYDFHQYKIEGAREDFSTGKKSGYALFKQNNWLSPVMEIRTPPPRVI